MNLQFLLWEYIPILGLLKGSWIHIPLLINTLNNGSKNCCHGIFLILMYQEKIKHISIEIKVINLDLERIKARLEDANRTIKEILYLGEIGVRAQELKELVEFNRFLLQKHKEKIADKHNAEIRLKNIVQEENKHELKLMEDEKSIEYFMLTLDKSLEFNSSHPFYNSPSFIRDLLKEFLKKEDYEYCSIMKNRLEELSMGIAK